MGGMKGSEVRLAPAIVDFIRASVVSIGRNEVPLKHDADQA
jgi:hypothetical protein